MEGGLKVRWLQWCLLAIVCFSPLPLGGMRPWSGALLSLLAATCLVAWALAAWRAPTLIRVSLRRIWLPVVVFLSVCVWAGAQTSVWLPESWGHPVWTEAESALGALSHRVSATPWDGRDALMRLLAYGSVFFLSLQMGRSADSAGTMIDAVAISGGLYAAYGLLVFLAGNDTILWMEKWAYRDSLTATLVNRNHYATLAGLGLLCATVSLARRLTGLTVRQIVRRFLLRRERTLWALAGSAVLLALALALTQSRGGIAATALAGATLFALTRSVRLAFGLGVALALGVVALGERVAGVGEDGGDRLRIYALAVDLIIQRPWLGSGLASFADVFQAVRPVEVVQLWDHVHNSWLETLVELGVPAGMALFGVLFWAAGRCVHGAMTRRRHAMYPVLGAAASVLVGCHALVDYSIQVPAVALTYALSLGVGVAQSWSSRHHHTTDAVISARQSAS